MKHGLILTGALLLAGSCGGKKTTIQQVEDPKTAERLALLEKDNEGRLTPDKVRTIVHGMHLNGYQGSGGEVGEQIAGNLAAAAGPGVSGDDFSRAIGEAIASATLPPEEVAAAVESAVRGLLDELGLTEEQAAAIATAVQAAAPGAGELAAVITDAINAARAGTEASSGIAAGRTERNAGTLDASAVQELVQRAVSQATAHLSSRTEVEEAIAGALQDARLDQEQTIKAVQEEIRLARSDLEKQLAGYSQDVGGLQAGISTFQNRLNQIDARVSGLHTAVQARPTQQQVDTTIAAATSDLADHSDVLAVVNDSIGAAKDDLPGYQEVAQIIDERLQPFANGMASLRDEIGTSYVNWQDLAGSLVRLPAYWDRVRALPGDQAGPQALAAALKEGGGVEPAALPGLPDLGGLAAWQSGMESRLEGGLERTALGEALESLQTWRDMRAGIADSVRTGDFTSFRDAQAAWREQVNEQMAARLEGTRLGEALESLQAWRDMRAGFADSVRTGDFTSFRDAHAAWKEQVKEEMARRMEKEKVEDAIAAAFENDGVWRPFSVFTRIREVIREAWSK